MKTPGNQRSLHLPGMVGTPRRGVAGLAGGFSLIELLVVIAIIGVLAVLAIGPLGSLLRSSEINRAGQILADEMMLARQTATARNLDVEVRLVELPRAAEPPSWRGVQLWIADSTGAMEPMGRLREFPDRAVIALEQAISPLLTADTNRSGVAAFGAHGQRPWRGFRVRPGGALDLGIVGSTNNFLTVVSDLPRDEILPDNFFTVRVNPVTGRVTIHRP